MSRDLGGLSSAYRTDAQSGRRVRRYSRLVNFMKFALPLAALAGVGLFYLSQRPPESLGRLFTPEELALLSSGLKLDNPSFRGVTPQGRHFEISADWAVPDSAMPNFIDLERPRGEIELGAARRVSVVSSTGRLHRHDEMLVLSGDVVLDTSDGYHLETDRLDFDLDARTAHAPGPVSGEGPNGTIEAGSMRLAPPDDGDDVGTQIWFENRVRLVLSPPSAAGHDARN